MAADEHGSERTFVLSYFRTQVVPVPIPAARPVAHAQQKL